jgi:hypothetical protein
MMMIEEGHRHLLGYSTLLTARLSSEARDYKSMIRCRSSKARWMQFTIQEDDVEEEDLLLIYFIAV